jgi:hypothetical protein
MGPASWRFEYALAIPARIKVERMEKIFHSGRTTHRRNARCGRGDFAPPSLAQYSRIAARFACNPCKQYCVDARSWSRNAVRLPQHCAGMADIRSEQRRAGGIYGSLSFHDNDRGTFFQTSTVRKPSRSLDHGTRRGRGTIRHGRAIVRAWLYGGSSGDRISCGETPPTRMPRASRQTRTNCLARRPRSLEHCVA